MRLLVTGFPPFPGRPVNPSELLVRDVQKGGLNLPGVDVQAELLPVEYQRVEQEFSRLVRHFHPEVILSFGVGRQNVPFRFEQRGRNWDDHELPDNAGERRENLVICTRSPHELHSPVKLESLSAALREAGLRAEVGDDAGTYVCNHLLFHGLRQAAEAAGAFEFVFTHLAPVESGMTAKTALLGLHIMAGWFHNQRPGVRGTFLV